MLNRCGLLRLTRVLALLVQVAIPTLGVVADAHMELESAAHPLHMESESHDCHARGHPPDCAVCHYLRGVIVTPSVRVAVLTAEVAGPLPPTTAAPTSAGRRLVRPARAPPHLS